ncbi:MAG: hypothetical protein NW217_08695 [Hyphomicrobiaceae bacterium]|nr:hypothetical protein [Hyphomicrobiaceae bacterium]
MLDMVRNSITLFFRGKLFADPGKAYRQLAIGIVLTLLCFLAARHLAGLPYWGAAALAGFVGGAVQPYLFRDLRYR